MKTQDIEDVAQALVAGKPAIFPTETVYGLGVSVEHAASPACIYELKRRAANKPIAWLVGSIDDLDRYGAHVPESVRAAARSFWPGPLTLIVKASDRVPAAFVSPQGTIGLRMPANRTALELLSRVGCPLATTSANPSGEAAPHTVGEIDADLAAAVGFVLTDAEPKSGVASTIIDCTGSKPVILREGALRAQDLNL